MSKKEKLYDLRLSITTEAERIRFLMENVVEETVENLQANILADLALEKSIRIKKLSEKIGKILNH